MWFTAWLWGCLGVLGGSDGPSYDLECEDLCRGPSVAEWSDAGCPGDLDEELAACEDRCVTVLSGQPLACAACILDESWGPWVGEGCTGPTDSSGQKSTKTCDYYCIEASIGSPVDCVEACSTATE